MQTRKIVILGGTRGMGRALGRAFAARGDRLALLGRNEDELQRSAADLEARGASGKVATGLCDLERSEGFEDALDRVSEALGGFDTVIVTAGNQPWSDSRWVEAELIRDLLVKWGVPHNSILLEGSSRNTRENALYSRNIINAIGCTKTLLVTSAAHMPRSVAAFNSVNVGVTPVSTDVRIAGNDRFLLLTLLPDVRALDMTSKALRELIGQKVYEFQGWN